MSDNNKKDGFIMQAGILAIAGILSRVIGILYNVPVVAILGDEGNGYYSSAYNAYAIVLLISSYSIPSAISKVIAQKLALKEYKNAHRIFKCALIYVVIVGGIASLFVFFGAGWMVQGNSVPVLRVFAPTIFLSGILGVLRGYFQAHRTMLQTSVSQILEQILNAVISITMAYVLTGMVVEADTTKRAIYGAVGGAVGTGTGVLIALLFMWGVYGLNRGTIKRRIARDRTTVDENMKDIFKMILLVVTPFILSTCIYNVNTFLNQTIFTKIMINVKSLSEPEASSFIGVISNAAKIANIPIAISSAMSAALIPGIAGDFSLGHIKSCQDKVGKAIRTTMFISIPAAVGIGVLAKPIMMVLFWQPLSLKLGSKLLMVMAVSIIFYSMSTLSNAVLQGIGRVNSPVINATIALAIQTVILVPVLYYTEMNAYAMAMATVIYSLLICIFNGFSIRRHLKYKQEWDKTFVRPLVASIVMGGAAYGSYQGIYYLCINKIALLFVETIPEGPGGIVRVVNIIALIAAVAIGAAIYFILTIKWGVIDQSEAQRIPKGASIVRLVNKIGPKKSRTHKKKKAGVRKKPEIEEEYWLDD